LPLTTTPASSEYPHNELTPAYSHPVARTPNSPADGTHEPPTNGHNPADNTDINSWLDSAELHNLENFRALPQGKFMRGSP